MKGPVATGSYRRVPEAVRTNPNSAEELPNRLKQSIVTL